MHPQGFLIGNCLVRTTCEMPWRRAIEYTPPPPAASRVRLAQIHSQRHTVNQAQSLSSVFPPTIMSIPPDISFGALPDTSLDFCLPTCAPIAPLWPTWPPGAPCPRRRSVHRPIPTTLSPAVRAGPRLRNIPARLTATRPRRCTTPPPWRTLVVVTPTASGKTLCYNLPLFEALQSDPAVCALCLFPTKALAQDQLAGLRGWVQDIPAALP